MKLEEVLKQIEDLRGEIDQLKSRVDKKDIEVCELNNRVIELENKLNTIENNTQTIININEKQTEVLGDIAKKLVDSKTEKDKIVTEGEVEIKKKKWDILGNSMTQGGIGMIIIIAIIEFIKKLFGL